MNIQKRLLPAGTPPPQRPGPPPTTTRQVLRVPRACTSCRRQKMRCDGPDNPPCTRCRLSGQACVFEKVSKPDQMDSSSLERLTEVENEIATVKNNQTVMQSTLMDILSELRRSNGRPADPPTAIRPSLVSPRAATNGLSDHSSSSPPTPSNAALPSSHRADSNTLPSLNSIIASGTASPVDIESYSKYSWTGFSPGGTSRPHRTADAATHHVTFAFPRPVHHTSRRSGTMTPYRDSGVSSPANSDVDIPAHALVAPIEVINDLAEAPSEQGRPNKKRKRTESFGVGDYSNEPSQSADQSGAGTSRRELDVVQKGLISESEAQELYNLYFSGCYRILAMFDPKRDTYESLRRRSPFCFCCLLMVGAKVRDGGGQPSTIQLLLEKEATEAAKNTLFKPFKMVEVVQGMLLLAAWSYSTGGTGWITAGHALRCAVDIGLDKALPRLATRLQEGQAGEGEMDQNLVRASRTWCALFVFEYQLAFGMRRPAMMGDNATDHINLAREVLLKHPLCIPTDVRLVSTCQLLCLQYKIHQRLGFGREEQFSDQYIIDVLREARTQIDSWQNEWDIIMSMHHGEHGFFRSSAAIQRAYAHLFHNSLAMQNIRTKAQAKAISPEIKSIAFEAVDAAKEALNIVLHTAEYREGLRFAISYTHTCAAFAGGFLLRMARLFPHDFDINETCALVESVAQVLSEVPAKRFSEALYNMLGSLRNRKRANTLEGSMSATAVPGFLSSLEAATHEPHVRPHSASSGGAAGGMITSGFTPDGVYSTGSMQEGPYATLDPLFPSWLTDFQFDGAAFLSGTDYASHFG